MHACCAIVLPALTCNSVMYVLVTFVTFIVGYSLGFCELLMLPRPAACRLATERGRGEEKNAGCNFPFTTGITDTKIPTNELYIYIVPFFCERVSVNLLYCDIYGNYSRS